MPRQRPRRVDNLNQPLERKLLVAVGRQIGRPHPPNQLPHARIARRVGAQHQRVDEEPDQIVQRRVGASRYRAPQRDVAPRPKPRQQPCQPSLQHHEQARPLLPRQPRKTTVKLRPQREPNPLAPIARNRRPRPVARQIDLLGQSRKSPGPERQLARNRAVSIALRPQDRMLPQRVVGILNRQRRKISRTAVKPRRIKPRKIPPQNPQRPPVPGDVMQHQKQNVLVPRQRKQMRPQRRLHAKVEPSPRRPRQRRAQPSLAHRPNHQPRPRRVSLQDLLPRNPKPVREHRAQALVPLNQVPKRTFQRRRIERPKKPDRQRDRVGRAPPFQTVQEPQPTLRKRQRDLPRPPTGPQRRPRRRPLRR